MIFEGALSVKACMLGNKRKINTIFIDENKKSKDISFIVAKANELNISLERCSLSEIEKLATGKTHGGIICDADNREYQKLNDCFNECSFIGLIEGIEDPFNLGYALRTLYSAGASGVIMPYRDLTKGESVICKSSAGASEYINIYLSKDIKKDIDLCKENGCVLYSAMRKDAIVYYDADFTKPMILAIGGELRGLSKDVLDSTDQNIYIPYANDFRNALNAASAISAISFEVVRQRGYNK